MNDKLSVLNKTKGRLPSLPLLLMKKGILGNAYSLSIAFIGKEKMKKLNNTYRGKNNPTNILSFPLSKNEGEILICPAVVKNETKKLKKDFRRLLSSLVIHGMLHLKGMTHGSTMERVEKRYDKKYFDRH